MAIGRQRWNARLKGAILILHRKGIVLGNNLSSIIAEVNASSLPDDAKRAFMTLVERSQNPALENEFDSSMGDALGRKDVTYIINYDGRNFLNKLVTEADYSSLFDDKIKELNRRQRKRKITILSVIAAIILIIVGSVRIYNLDYFAEKRDYNTYIDRPYSGTYEAYMNKWKDYNHPQHLPDIIDREARRQFYEIIDDSHISNNSKIGGLNRLRETFPDNVVADRARASIDSIWDAEISDFKEKYPGYDSSPVQKAMYELLLHARQTGSRDIVITVKQVDKAKKFTDYSPLIQYWALGDENISNVGCYESTYFDSDGFGGKVQSKYQTFISSFFSPYFFEFSTDTVNISPNTPRLDITTTISNSHLKDLPRVPYIWYFEQGVLHIKTYYIGIEVGVKSTLDFDGMTKPWTFSATGSVPESHTFRNIQENTPYKAMFTLCLDDIESKLNRSADN